MFTLTAAALAVLGTAGWAAARIAAGRGRSAALHALLHLGLFAFFFGLLSQAIALYQMMRAIESFGNDVSPALVAGGLSVSMIAPIYGLIICVVAVLLRLGLGLWDARAPRTATDA